MTLNEWTPDQPTAEEEIGQTRQSTSPTPTVAPEGEVLALLTTLDTFARAQVFPGELCARAAATIRRLGEERDLARGAMRADDERLRQAEARVWPDMTHGCDAPEWMADEILSLRAALATALATAHAKVVASDATAQLAERNGAERALRWAADGNARHFVLDIDAETMRTVHRLGTAVGPKPDYTESAEQYLARGLAHLFLAVPAPDQEGEQMPANLYDFTQGLVGGFAIGVLAGFFAGVMTAAWLYSRGSARREFPPSMGV